MLIHIGKMKTVSYIDGIKGLHTNCRLASCFHELRQGTPEWLSWNCMICVFFNAGPVCDESTAHWQIPLQAVNSANFAVWLRLFALLVERWCLIKCFRIAGRVCGFSISSQWFLLTKEAKLWCLLSCLSKQAVEQTVEMQVSRKLMKVRICHCYVICHSVIDDITGSACVRWNHWSPVDSRCKGLLEWSFGGPVCGDSIAGGFPS